MRFRVRLFAAARQSVNQDTVEIELGEKATIADLRRQLAAQFPEIAPIVERAAFAVGESYANDATVLSKHADVACIPPVSGG